MTRRAAYVWAARFAAIAYPILAGFIMFACARWLLMEFGVARSDFYAAIGAAFGVLVNSPEFLKYLLRAFRLPVNQ